MLITVIGSSGSVSGPESAASCYLVQAEEAGKVTSVVLDMGSGAYGQLSRYLDPGMVDALLLSHLHADHVVDTTSLEVHLKYAPPAPTRRCRCYGPEGTEERLRELTGLLQGTAEERRRALPFTFRTWQVGKTFTSGRFHRGVRGRAPRARVRDADHRPAETGTRSGCSPTPGIPTPATDSSRRPGARTCSCARPPSKRPRRRARHPPHRAARGCGGERSRRAPSRPHHIAVELPLDDPSGGVHGVLRPDRRRRTRRELDPVTLVTSGEAQNRAARRWLGPRCGRR